MEGERCGETEVGEDGRRGRGGWKVQVVGEEGWDGGAKGTPA